jgi:hypothetical protein
MNLTIIGSEYRPEFNYNLCRHNRVTDPRDEVSIKFCLLNIIMSDIDIILVFMVSAG